MRRTLLLMKTIALPLNVTARKTTQQEAVPWYRRQYKGAKAQHLWQAGWGISLLLVFVGLPLVGATVQSHLKVKREKRRAIMNDAEREEFLRDLYGLGDEDGAEGNKEFTPRGKI